MFKFCKVGLVATAIAGGLLCASAANATTISIGLQEAGYNGGSISTLGTATTGFLQASGAYGTFTVNGITAQDATTLAAPDLLNSQSINTSSNSAGTLYVYVTTSGLTSPTGPANLISTFTTNALSGTMSVTETSYYSTLLTPYATTTQLATASFTALGTMASSTATTLASTYSLTEVYKITSTGAGNSNLTIDIQSVPVPEPVSIALLGTGLVGIGIARRRRIV